MAEEAQTFQKAFSVRFSQINRWDPNSFHGIDWHWPRSFMAAIGSVLNQRKEKVDRNRNEFSDLMPVTIHFDGSIEPRKISKDKEYSMGLFWARQGDIVVSKIDLKNGAVAIIPSGWDTAVVTNHFAVYEPDLTKLDPRYFLLLIQAKFFKEHLWRNKVGAEGRKEVKLDFFESQEVPIPPLQIQKRIVDHWAAAQKIKQHNHEVIARTKTAAIVQFRKALGMQSTDVVRPKLFIAQWCEVERWGNELAWSNKNAVKRFDYPVKPLKRVCKTGSGGTPSRKHKEYYGSEIPWVKTSEVRNTVIFDTEEKISSKGLASSSAKLYPAGSIVIAMYGQGATRGRTAKLGVDAATNQACLVLTQIDPLLDTDFLWYYLMVSYDEMRGLASGNNQPNLSADLLGGFPVPVPPARKQTELKTLFETAQRKVEDLVEHSARIHSQATKEIEEMILGIHPVKES